MSVRLAYMTGEYPRSSDTFIQREVAALRRLGAHVDTISIRRTRNEEHVGPEQREEASRTYAVLPASIVAVFAAHIAQFARFPVRWLQSLRLAWRTRAPGGGALLRQAAYFLEAGLVAQRMKRQKLDHLHNHFANSSCTVAMLAAEMGGFSYSFTVHGPAIWYEPSRWRLDEKIRRALFVSCISEFCRSQAMIWAPPERWDRLHIVHCGVEPERYSSARRESSGERLLFVGRLAKVKGLPVLIDAMATLRARRPNARLTIVGEGPDRRWLEQRVKRLGLEGVVEFVGRRSQDQVREHLRDAAVFVLPSFAEGVPVVLMEAMAAGVAVVATRVAGTSELVEDGESGFLAPPGDVRTLDLRIETLLDDDGLRSRFADAARRKVEREFNASVEARWLLRILQARLAGESPPVRRGEAEAGASSAASHQLAAQATAV